MITVDIISAVAPLYPILTPLGVLTYHILNTLIYRTYLNVYAAGGTTYAVYIHARGCPYMAWCAEKRVGGIKLNSYNPLPRGSIYGYFGLKHVKYRVSSLLFLKNFSASMK